MESSHNEQTPPLEYYVQAAALFKTGDKLPIIDPPGSRGERGEASKINLKSHREQARGCITDGTQSAEA